MTKNLQPIGAGAFTKAYLNTETNKVILRTVCPVKVAVAEGICVTQGYLLPVSRILDNEGDHTIIEIEHLARPRSLKSALKPSHWELYQWLRKNLDGASSYWEIQKIIKQIPSRWSKARSFLYDAVDGICNYVCVDDLACEISPRNVGVRNGKDLVLFDIFYCKRALREQRKNR